MSVRVMAWVWKQETKSSGERLVLLALADHAGEDGECYPSTGHLGKKCSLDPKTVQRHLTALDERGLVSKLYRRKRQNGTLAGWTYRVNIKEADSTSTTPLRERTDVLTETVHACVDRDSTPTRWHESSVSNHQLETSVVDALWEQFWKMYPRKTNKQTASKAWDKLRDCVKATASEVLQLHVEHWERSKTQQQFIPHASTWLNARRWEDELVRTQTKEAPGMAVVRRLLEEARTQQ